jgi:hypothetical protein
MVINWGMDSLIAGLDLPAVPLSEQQQQELDKQRAIQQQKIKDIKAQLENADRY